MTDFLFPDNTVLCNFAAARRLDILETVLDGRGRWTEAVAREAARSTPYLPALSQVPAEGWLGEPIEIDDLADIREIERVRRAVFGGRDNRPRQHMGEAQTCYLIQKWSDFAGSWWISDDKESLRYARGQGITTCETIDLVKIAVSDGTVDVDEAFDLMCRMWDLGRRLTMPRTADELSD